MAEMTPMMVHYLETKKSAPDCILFYRLGDFYEMFFEDAIMVSKELEITLTGKNCGLEERAPMCGVPFHAAENYISKLVANGHKVAICEQVEDPKLAKGMVKREIVRIVTPGTNTSTITLDETKNNYLMCIIWDQEHFGVSTVDVTTGDFYITQVDTARELMDEVNKFHPSEIICNSALVISGFELEEVKNRLNVAISNLDDRMLDSDNARRILCEHFHVQKIDGLGLTDLLTAADSAGALLEYLQETLKTDLVHITDVNVYRSGRYMIIDSATRRNLELTETMRDKAKRGSLLWVLDKTRTAMGGRMLRSYIEQPLIDKEQIEKKVKRVLELVNLKGFEERSIDSLSGGQQQRIAIARAIVNEPKVLLLDEPLAALDLKLRQGMQLELKNMQRELGITFLYVTHDQEEALTMSDTIVVMKEGTIQQIGTPTDIYNEPKNAYVADFIGESNIISGIMKQDCLVNIFDTDFECVDIGFEKDEPVDVVIRPEDVYILEPEKGKIAGRVESVLFKGVHYEMVIESNGYKWLVHDTAKFEVGKEVSLFVKPFDIHIMKKS